MTHQTYAKVKKVTRQQKILAYLRLTRWREHVPYTIPVVLCGALMAAHTNHITMDWRLFPVLGANILAMTFAFMINDVEDAPDDARDSRKRQHNVISMGILSQMEGIGFGISLFFLALVLYALGGWKTFGTGGLTLVLCYLYSASPFRLKSRPIIDVVSHALMLGGLLMVSGYVIYDAYPEKAWLMILAITFASAYGQFYNQVDDFDNDKRAGLHNTAMLLGKKLTYTAMYGCLIIGAGLFISAVLLHTFPLWLGPILIAVIFTLSLFRWNYDMRGGETNASGLIQTPTLIAANIIVLIWFLFEMGWLVLPTG